MSRQVSIERMRVIADKLRGAGFAPVSVVEYEGGYDDSYRPTAWIDFHGEWTFFRDGSCEVPESIVPLSPLVLRAWALASELWLDTPDSEVTA